MVETFCRDFVWLRCLCLCYRLNCFAVSAVTGVDALAFPTGQGMAGFSEVLRLGEVDDRVSLRATALSPGYPI